MSEPAEGGFRTLGDLETAAQPKVIEEAWAYVQGGAGDERTLRANREAFARRTLRQRALVDIRHMDLATTILGRAVQAPFFVAPMAYQGLVHPEAEEGTARAAAAAGVLSAYSTLTTVSLEEVAAAAPGAPRWFQLYLQPEFERTQALLARAEQAGYEAVILTVDVPVLANRDRQAQGGVATEAPLLTGNGLDIVSPLRRPSMEGSRCDLGPVASTTWEAVDRLRQATRLPVIVKGILTAEDARLAARHGARGVIVSNHGGRQLDCAVAALDALPEVVAEVGRELEVYMDSGVRRGSDVLVALALGARAVGVGRPVLWGLGAGGQVGVEKVLRLLKEELVIALAMSGRRTVAEIDGGVLGPTRPSPA